MQRYLLIASMLLLTACGGNPDRYIVSPAAPDARQRIAFSALEIREVSLPAYAAADEISRLDPDGRLVSDGGTLWADTPDRAISLELARLLSQISGARVASAPWPFETLPTARLDVRFDTLLARPDGLFQARGQYFVAVPEGRERSGLFDLAVPYDPETAPQSIAVARGAVISDLALYIARNGLR